MSKAQPGILIYHLSDLHFGPYLEGVSGEGEWSSFFAPHSFLLLQGMEIALEFWNVIKNDKDRLMVAVTGDLTTTAEPPAYHNANNYLRDHPFVSTKLQVGLRLQEITDRIFFVPGNHDIWFYGNWFTRWKRFSDRRKLYMKYFGETIPNVYPLLINGISVTVFTIDTNRVEKFNFINFKNVLGKGEVGKAQIADIQTLHLNLLHDTSIDVPSGYDYPSSLKIALMHHHLSVPKDVPRDTQESILELKDTDPVLNLLSEIGVQLVLCGHQHFPYHIPNLRSSKYSNKPILLSCAGSATQMGNEKNSFSKYEIIKKESEYVLRLRVYESNYKSGDYFFKNTVDTTLNLGSQ